MTEVTGLAIDHIEQVVLCTNGTISAQDREELLKIGHDGGVSTEVLTLSKIAMPIYYNHKSIVRDIMGLTVESGQILSPPDFIQEYERVPTATSLSYKLYGREKEVESLVGPSELKRIELS